MSLTVHGDVDLAGVNCLEQLIADCTIGSAFYIAETGSTNSDAIESLKSEPTAKTSFPRVYFTDRQVAGRGRHGRTWVSPPGTLTFSVVVDRSTPDNTKADSISANLLSLVVGVAVAQAIEHECAPLKTHLKWPNDVYIDGGKVAGVLLETTQTAPNLVVIGIGVNVNEVPQLCEAPASNVSSKESETKTIGSPAEPKSIANCIGRSQNLFSLLGTILERLGDLQTATPDEIVREFQQRCFLSDKEIRFEFAGETQTAMCVGVNELGELTVKQHDSVQNLCAGEVHLVRVRNERQ